MTLLEDLDPRLLIGAKDEAIGPKRLALPIAVIQLQHRARFGKEMRNPWKEPHAGFPEAHGAATARLHGFTYFINALPLLQGPRLGINFLLAGLKNWLIFP